LRSFFKDRKNLSVPLTGPHEGPTYYQSYFLKSEAKELFDLQTATLEHLKEFNPTGGVVCERRNWN
jgi:hypothetical protein